MAKQRPPVSAVARRSKGRVSAGIPEAETARNTATAAPAPGCSVTAARPAGSTHRAVDVLGGAHTAADGQRDEDPIGGAGDDVERGGPVR